VGVEAEEGVDIKVGDPVVDASVAVVLKRAKGYNILLSGGMGEVVF
jgi:hypothetical protein